MSAGVSAGVSGVLDGDGDPDTDAGSPTMCRPTFDALDRSWAEYSRSPEATAALRRWIGVAHLEASDLEALVQRTWRADRLEADRTCAALARLAPSDLVAARVLLQVLRPGLRSLGRRMALGGVFDDVDQDLLAIAWERIRTYPIDRRPSSVAANILLDVRKHYVAGALASQRRNDIALDQLPSDRWPAAPSAESEAIDGEVPSLRRVRDHLATAVDRGTISPAGAQVVWRTRIQQDHDQHVASELSVSVRTLQRRRQRAERRLATAS